MRKTLLMLTLSCSFIFAQNSIHPFEVFGYGEDIGNGKWEKPLLYYPEISAKALRSVSVRWFNRPTENFNFEFYDNIADFYALYDLEPIITFQCIQDFPDTSINADTSGWSFCEKQNWINYHDDEKSIEDGASWFPKDTLLWKEFLTTFVERYDSDGIDDYENLIKPFVHYQFEVEIPRVWCIENDQWHKNFVDYVNLSAKTIRSADPNARVKFAGWTRKFDTFLISMNMYDIDSLTLDNGIITDVESLIAKLNSQPDFLLEREQFNYIFSNIDVNVLDIHCYGRAELMPYRAKALKELYGVEQVWASEGGGPFIPAAEIFNPLNEEGVLTDTLIIENASYIIRHYIGGLANGFSRIGWKLWTTSNNQWFNDIALLDYSNSIKKPSYWVYKWLAELIRDPGNFKTIPNSLYWYDENITAYQYITGEETYNFIWNLKGSSEIILTGVKEKLTYPTILGNSNWHSSNYQVNDKVIFMVNRNPLILKGDIKSSDITSVEDSELPSEFSLYQNYPNPFNPSTTITFTIPSVGDEYYASPTVLKIYDILGNEITTLINKELRSGTYEIDFDAGDLPSGIYFYRIATKEFFETKKMVLIR